MSDLPDIEILTADGRVWLRCDDSNDYYARLHVGEQRFNIIFDPKGRRATISEAAPTMPE